MPWIFVIESKIKRALTGFEMAATEICVMITVSGSFFCALRGDHRQLYANILCSREEPLFCFLVGLALCLFCVCVCVVFKYCFLIYSSIGVLLCSNALRFIGIYLTGIYELWIITVVSRIRQCYQFSVQQNNTKKENRMTLYYYVFYF